MPIGARLIVKYCVIDRTLTQRVRFTWGLTDSVIIEDFRKDHVSNGTGVLDMIHLGFIMRA